MTAPRTHGRLIGEHVTLYDPTPHRPYYRLIVTNPDGTRRQLSAGKSAAGALQRAKQLDAELRADRGGAPYRTLGDLVAEYVSTPRGRKRTPQGRLTGERWQPNHHASVTQLMTRAVEDIQSLPAHLLDAAAIDQMRTACGTPNQVEHQTSTVRNFLRWCEEEGALTLEQVALLASTHAPVRRPRFPQAEPRPERPRLARMQGQSADFVGDEDCPTRRDLLALAEAMQHAVSWGELAVHLASGAGLRQGEQFQLRAEDIEIAADGTVYIRVDAQWCDGPTRRADPKHRKRRIVPLSPLTRDGYPLAARLVERATEAVGERQERGHGEALLFPAPIGGIWWSSTLSSKLIVPAMKAAGWGYTVVHEQRHLRNGQHRSIEVTQMHRTWHSLRHRFARDMIDYFSLTEGALMAIGGWENLDVVQARYYRTGIEHVQMAARLLQNRSA